MTGAAGAAGAALLPAPAVASDMCCVAICCEHSRERRERGEDKLDKFVSPAVPYLDATAHAKEAADNAKRSSRSEDPVEERIIALYKAMKGKERCRGWRCAPSFAHRIFVCKPLTTPRPVLDCGDCGCELGSPFFSSAMLHAKRKFCGACGCTLFLNPSTPHCILAGRDGIVWCAGCQAAGNLGPPFSSDLVPPSSFPAPSSVSNLHIL